MNIRISFLVLAFSFFIYTGFAQWSGCSGINTPVCDTTKAQNGVQITKDGRNGAYVIWQDNRNNPTWTDIYCQNIDSNGVSKWKKNGIKIEQGQYHQLVNDNNGGVFIFYITGDYKIHAQRVDKNGNLMWPAAGIYTCYNYNGKTMEFKVISDKMGGAILVSGGGDISGNKPCILAQRIDSNGILHWPFINKTGGTLDPGNVNGYDVMVDENHTTIITWQQMDFDINVYMQKLDTNGNALLGTNGVIVTNASNNQFDPKICTDRVGGYFINWSGYPVTGQAQSYMQHYDASGNKLFPVNGILSDTMSHCPLLLSSVDSGVFVLHYNMLRKLDKNGKVLWSVVTSSEVDANVSLSAKYHILNDTEGGVFIIWYQNGILANHIDKNGHLLWGASGIVISNPSPSPFDVQVVNDETGGFIASWTDVRNYNEDIYAQRVNKFGMLYGKKSLYASIKADANSIGSLESTYIRISGAKGPITWQSSTDSINFNITYQTTSNIFLVDHLQSTRFYRAIIQIPYSCYDTTEIIKINFKSNLDHYLGIIPNPFSSSTVLQTDKFFRDATLTVYNTLGQTVKQIKHVSSQTFIFHRDNLTKGFYLLRLTQDDELFAGGKLIIID